MKKLAKNTVYVVVIHIGADSYNTYSKVTYAYKITNGKRMYFDTSGERVSFHTGATQVATEFLNKKGFIVPDYLSDAQNLITIEHKVKYSQLLT